VVRSWPRTQLSIAISQSTLLEGKSERWPGVGLKQPISAAERLVMFENVESVRRLASRVALVSDCEVSSRRGFAKARDEMDKRRRILGNMLFAGYYWQA